MGFHNPHAHHRYLRSKCRAGGAARWRDCFGSYQPADYYTNQYDTTETFSNSPVPIGPYNANLAVFGGLSANGTWSLYIEDDAEGDAGAISNGWSLAFTTITPVNQVADLAATIAALTNQVILGNNITNIWTVTNNGPDAADVFVTNILPAGLAFFTNTLPPGADQHPERPDHICNLGSLIQEVAWSLPTWLRQFQVVCKPTQSPPAQPR